jgi:hypothetical protein
MNARFGWSKGWVLLTLLAASGCNDDKDPAPAPPAPAATFTVGGSVSGLTGSVTLANNGGDARTVSANGGFTFATVPPTEKVFVTQATATFETLPATLPEPLVTVQVWFAGCEVMVTL